MDKKATDFTLSCYTSNLWIKQIISLRQSDGKFFYLGNNHPVYVRFITVFGIISEFRHIGEQCLLYTVDDGTGLLPCRYNVNTRDVDDLEDWDWKDFDISETFNEKSQGDDTIFNDATIQPEDKISNRNSRLKALESLRWSIINSFRSYETFQVGDAVCVHGRVYSYFGNIQIHVNIIRPITMIEELTLMTVKLADCGLLAKVSGAGDHSSTNQVNSLENNRKRASGLMTFDTTEETQLRVKPRTEMCLPPTPRIVPGTLSFPSSVPSVVTFDTMIPGTEEDMAVSQTP